MIEGQFSRTALAAAGYRAAHQVAEGGAVLFDPFAGRVLGADLPAYLEHCADPKLKPLRLFIALRSRIAEDVARRAIATGVRQVVALGAGLDTFACRAPPMADLVAYEVDHPVTQAEKRRRLSEAGIEAPALRFCPCDFERETLGEALTAAGFDPQARAAFLWLGVTPYLTREAFERTLRFVAGLEGGADIVFDYANPPHSIASPGHRLFQEQMAERVAAAGEAFRSYFETAELHGFLATLGCARIADVGPREIAQRLAHDGPAPPENGGHILHAFFPPR